MPLIQLVVSYFTIYNFPYMIFLGLRNLKKLCGIKDDYSHMS